MTVELFSWGADPVLLTADWCEPDEDAAEGMCDESCDRFTPGGPTCTCYGTHEETTEGGW